MGCEEVVEGEVLQGRSLRELPESDGGARVSEYSRDHRSPQEEPETRNDFQKQTALKPLYNSTIPCVRTLRRRDGAQFAGPRLPVWKPGFRGWRSESGTELHWWYLAAVCSACAAYGLPCWPVDKAGSGWTHERVPQKPNQNALQFLLRNCLPGRYYLAPPVQPGRPIKRWEAPNFLFPFLDAQSVPVVLESWRTIARYGIGLTTRPQRNFRLWESICPRSQSRRVKKRTDASKGEPQLNMTREKTDGLCNFAHCNMPLWMVTTTLNPVGLRVNCFFREFVLTNGGWKLDGKHEVNLFLISDMRSQLQKGILAACACDAAGQSTAYRLEGPRDDFGGRLQGFGGMGRQLGGFP